MGEQKNDRKTKYTRMVLRESLIDLMKTKPLAKITIKELCEKADINRSTFYAHYSDQNELLRQIEDESLAHVREALENYDYKQQKAQAVDILEALMRYITENSNSIQVLLSDQSDGEFYKKLFALLDELRLINFMPKRIINEGAAKYFSIYVINGCIGVIQLWLKTEQRLTPREMAEMIITFTYLPSA